MPKKKTHSGTEKRVKVTGNGKLCTQQPEAPPPGEQVRARRTRRLTGTTEVAKADVKRVKKLLGR